MDPSHACARAARLWTTAAHHARWLLRMTAGPFLPQEDVVACVEKIFSDPSCNDLLTPYVEEFLRQT